MDCGGNVSQQGCKVGRGGNRLLGWVGVVDWLEGPCGRMLYRFRRVDIFHIPRVRIVGIYLGVFFPHLHVCVRICVCVAEEESGHIPSVYHYYSPEMHYGKIKEYNGNV